MSDTCWHCRGSHLCDCMFCGKDALSEGTIVRQDGPCGFCIATEFNERHRDVIDAYDPRDRNNWEYYPPADGNKKRRVYKPFKGLK